jgi:threonine dehydrogenase-like Zn-dependent dehydrogenase
VAHSINHHIGAQHCFPQNDLDCVLTVRVNHDIGINTFPPAIAMLESGAIDPTPITTHDLPVSRIHEGFDAVNKGQAVKVLVRPE